MKSVEDIPDLSVKESLFYLANLALNLRPTLNKRPTSWQVEGLKLDKLQHHIYNVGESGIKHVLFKLDDGTREEACWLQPPEVFDNPFTIDVRDAVAKRLQQLSSNLSQYQESSLVAMRAVLAQPLPLEEDAEVVLLPEQEAGFIVRDLRGSRSA